MSWIFDPQVLQSLVATRVGLPTRELITALTHDLAATYPGHIETKQNWFFNIAGGATGIMTVLHGSLSEYLIVFGTPVGTEGFSGRYRIDIFDVVLAGEMWTYTDDNFAGRTVFRPGDMALLERRRVKGFRLVEDCWLLEYGRGPVPTALPMALSGAFLSLDATTVGKTIYHYGRLTAAVPDSPAPLDHPPSESETGHSSILTQSVLQNS
jgi:C-8 sterol isomerase